MKQLVPGIISLLLPVVATSQVIALDDLQALTPHGTVPELAAYQGRDAVRVVEEEGAEELLDKIVVVRGLDFANGSIEIAVAGMPQAGAAAGARGFVGIAFHVSPDGTEYEAFYLRPTNGRAEDQLRRNHSAQYIAHPEHTWRSLRESEPGMYESYVDLEPGAWTQMRVEVDGTTARLFVHGAEQPTLIVNDLKLGEGNGAIALWIDRGTEAYFSNLRVLPE
ncbi:MAG: hypothetical protein ACJ0SL_01255 [Candidatus Rariloculaceae bacterium]